MSVVKQNIVSKKTDLEVVNSQKTIEVSGDSDNHIDLGKGNSTTATIAGDSLQVDKEQEKPKEWDPSKRWNPFNSYKLLAQVERWRHIKRGKPIPAPVLITVDPTNACNLNCVWCNAEFVRKKRKRFLSEKTLLNIADFLPHWGEGSGVWEPGVKAVCIAGGGEPLLNPATGKFIDRLVANEVEVGLVTNGTQIDKYIDSLSQAVWVGVSVDAGTKETFDKLKGCGGKDTFDRIIENIAILADYAKCHKNKLGWSHPAYGINFKFLLYKENIGEIYKATKLAKEIGCKNIHFRPAGTTWDKIGTEDEIIFSDYEIELFKDQIDRAMELDDSNFGVYGITHKFNSQFEAANYFNKCHAIFMTAVIMPPTSKNVREEAFIVGLCCDRRGDAKLELAQNIVDVNEIQKLWGSKKHWEMHDKIMAGIECPRCTYQPHNEIYEQVILNDSMTHKFI